MVERISKWIRYRIANLLGDSMSEPKPIAMAYKEYERKPRTVMARQVFNKEVIHCYNGVRVADIGDYVVLDSEDRLMVMKEANFKNTFITGETNG